MPIRPAAPILTGIRIRIETKKLAFSSSDYEVSANSHIPATIEEVDEVLASGHLLADISKSLPDKPVAIGLDGRKVKLTYGSSHFTLAVMPLGEYPLLSAWPWTAGTINSQVLSQAVSQVSVTASRGDTLPLLAGVRMEINGEHMTFLATDRYRLTMRELEWAPADPAFERIALVKARILQDVAKSMISGETVELGISDSSQQEAPSLIDFEASSRRTTSTLMDGDYSPVHRLFPESTPIQTMCDRYTLLEAVRCMSLVAERKTPVRLSFTDGSLALEAGQGDNAQTPEALEASLCSEDIATVFNPQFLIDGLSVMDMDYVRFGFTHPNKPAVMIGQTKVDGDEVTTFRYLLMSIHFGV